MFPGFDAAYTFRYNQSMMKSYQFPSRLVVILGLILLSMAPSGQIASQAAAMATRSSATSSTLANIRGEVTAKEGALSLAGARIDIPALGLNATSDSSGNFSWENIPLRTDLTPIDIRVTAPGYGTWTLQNALVRRDDTLILNVNLKDTPTFQRLPALNQLNSDAPAPLGGSTLEQVFAQTSSNQQLPATIQVGITGNINCSAYLTTTYSVQTVDFKSYVKHVLPNEFLNTWGQESLRAGAIAIKMYAWYWISLGGKWRGTDVIDSTCDQVYNPSIEYESTNQAVDYTWNWKLTRQGQLFQTQHKDMDNCGPPNCLHQGESAGMAVHGYTWDKILAYFYPGSVLSIINPGINDYALRFNGAAGDGPLNNRVLIPLLDPRNPENSLPVNVGADDFTIEWWMKTAPVENSSGPIPCGSNQAWRQANIIFDRSQTGAGSQFGIAIARGRLVLGITSANGENLSLCGTTSVADNQWHHIAFERRRADGWLWLFVDGRIDIFASGPQGDISYSARNTETGYFDPVLFLGGGKDYDGSLPHPFYTGALDEMRFSSGLRYAVTGSFQPPEVPFTPDPSTLALYHFDDGVGTTLVNSSGGQASMTNGRLFYGGQINGPVWLPTHLFVSYNLFIPYVTQNK
jgi:hypothetical protein